MRCGIGGGGIGGGGATVHRFSSKYRLSAYQFMGCREKIAVK